MFEEVESVDLIDAANTLKGRDSKGIHVSPPGDGVDKLLGWAIADVKLSAQAQDVNEQERFASNAILHARRALACLVEWYLKRDCFRLCNNAPSTAKKQSEILLERRIIDELTSRVLERAVEKRNIVEHQFLAPALETAEDVVELLRRSITSMITESQPSYGPCLFGSILGGIASGKNGERVFFYGWQEPSFILCTFVDRPWLGVIIPKSRGEAVVRRSFFDKTKVDTLMELLSILERSFGRISGYMDAAYWRLLAKEAGLDA